ncbi:hypothetical protein PAXRUDRAFT_10248 [Paxillus rubicundulus Ve08.2h10]|uniref:DDE-1 domain-containing protein n=1 Tax=Paxillus rubicundulus Ve08.2h10 TaxID=930991 RepID=A0A0D0E128_9AGAM|nr:hypothetical protein PAXRUDRAFT_10248 [Paxillus rubicundulus Ve08.2h10]
MKENIEEDCVWAGNETGLQPGGGTKEHIYGPKGKKMQPQQHDGNRENITVMVTICADDTNIPPLIIYKGLSYRPNWHQNNQLGALIAISKKGWTDGTIGCLWLEDFDKKTHAKAGARAQLLLVNGHNSHYTWEFLEYT